MRNKSSLLGLMGLAAALGSLRDAAPQPQISLHDGLPEIDELESMMMAMKSFKAMPESSRKAFDEIQRVFGSLKFEDVEGLFITVVTRDPESGPANVEPCGGCGEVHSGIDVMQMVSIMGDEVTMRAAVNVAMRKALSVVEKENGRIDPMPDFGRPKPEEVN